MAECPAFTVGLQSGTAMTAARSTDVVGNIRVMYYPCNPYCPRGHSLVQESSDDPPVQKRRARFKSVALWRQARSVP